MKLNQLGTKYSTLQNLNNMKVIIYILLYIILTVAYYLLLSSIGMLFTNELGVHYTFNQCYSTIGWAIFYFVIIHWWLVILSLMEYYKKYIEDLNL